MGEFTAHDLRRTGRTGLAKPGVRSDIGERVLNHARDRIETTYDVHGYFEEKREALNKWAAISPNFALARYKTESKT